MWSNNLQMQDMRTNQKILYLSVSLGEIFLQLCELLLHGSNWFEVPGKRV